MNPIDPLRPSSLDDVAGPAESGPADGTYGPAPSYTPYQWEMPWIPTPEPAAPRFVEPRPEPPPLPRYEDGLLTPGLFAMFMDELRDPPEPPQLRSCEDGLSTSDLLGRIMRDLDG